MNSAHQAVQIAPSSFRGDLSRSEGRSSNCKPVPPFCKPIQSHILAVVCGLAVLILFSSCSSLKPIDLGQVYGAYIGQTRTYEALRISGARKILIEGDNVEVVARNNLEPLSALQHEDTLKTIAGAATDILRIGTLGYVGGKLISQGPTVVNQPAPVIVKPEVITQ